VSKPVPMQLDKGIVRGKPTPADKLEELFKGSKPRKAKR
jgi:hypothetical protein